MQLRERFKNASHKTVGSKKTKKEIKNGNIQVVFIARDAESRVTGPLIELCEEKGLQIEYVENMQQLGEICGIDVKAASAGIFESVFSEGKEV